MKDPNEIERYKTPAGKPTCVLSFATDEICEYYHKAKFGYRERCNFDGIPLERDHEADGFTIPTNNCPVWKKEKENI